jgi:hypothetical protein
LELLDLAGRAELSPQAAIVIALCLLACEIRVAVHIVKHDRLRPSQVFLTSLRNYAAGAGHDLRTTFTPSYSERFFLQVVDGFKLDDSSAVSVTPGQAGRPGELILVRGWNREAPELIAKSADLTLLAHNSDYALLRRSSPLSADAQRSRDQVAEPTSVHRDITQ